MVRRGELRVAVGRIPALADNYQSRSELDVVRATWHRDNPTNTTVVQGMGGVGKTQFVAEHAWSIAGEVDVLMWVTAAKRETVVEAYSRAWKQLDDRDETGAEVQADRFLAWLWATDLRWLIVLDDVRASEDLEGLWPDGSSGRTVVTTRRTDNRLRELGRQVIRVEPFTPDRARGYLTGKLGSRSDPARDVDLLVEALGRLPLALAQAASFMLDRRVSCADYLRRFTGRRTKLSNMFPPDAPADGYRLTVATTWSISIEAADNLEPRGLCRPLMHVAALLDSHGFPSRVVETRAVVDYASGVSAEQCREALANLTRFSLVELQEGAEPSGVRVHTLVQRAVLDDLDPSQLMASASATSKGLAELWPDIEVDPALGEVLRANTAVMAGHPDNLLWRAHGYRLRRRAGRSLGGFGLLKKELAHWISLVEETERVVGAGDFRSLVVRQDLARARGLAGDPQRAAAEFEALVPDHVRVLGAASPYTFNARHGLAWWRGEAGFPADAVGRFQILVEDLVRERGEDDPQTLRTRYSLGRWRGQAGDPRQARADFADLLPDIRRVLGEDSPLAFAVRHDLAWWIGEAGTSLVAVGMFTSLLEDRLRVLGERHLHTLATRHDLAWWIGEAGDPVAAAEALENLLHDAIRFLGPEHPHIAATREDMDWWRASPQVRLTGGPRGQSRDDPGRVPGDLPGLDFLEIDSWGVDPEDQGPFEQPGEDHP